MHTGIVKIFNVKEQYGFIFHDNKDIFFHKAFGGMMACLGGDTPEFVKVKLDRDPVPRETILFEFDQGPRGFRATKWAFPETLQIALQQIQLRPKYRFIERDGKEKISKLASGTPIKYSVLWQGQNINDLKNMFPKIDNPIYENDQRARYFQIFSEATNDWVDYNGDPR